MKMGMKTSLHQSLDPVPHPPRLENDSNQITSPSQANIDPGHWWLFSRPLVRRRHQHQHVIMPTKSKVKARTSNSTTTPAKTPIPVPKWPALTPILPAVDLVLEETLQDQILTIRNLFTSTLCKNYVLYLSTLPLTTTPGKPKRGEATRVNDRFQVTDPAFAERLWSQTALKDLVTAYSDPSIFGGEILGLNPNIRIYRYTPSQFFDKHYDESNRISFGSEAIPAKTSWTLLIYLSTCEGGETIFYPEPASKKEKTPDPIVCELEVGLALLHRHGDDCLLHEGAEVKAGEKWVLRSDLIVQR